MRMVDLTCEVGTEEDGTFTLFITVSKLTLSEAENIAEAIRAPMREVLTEVMTAATEKPN